MPRKEYRTEYKTSLKSRMNNRASYNRHKEEKKEYQEQNRERIRAYHKEHYRQNKERYFLYNKINSREYSIKNPYFRPSINLYGYMRKSLINLVAQKKIKAERGWEKQVEYNVHELKAHIEKQFDDRMNWNNYGSYWQIDHIIPRYHYEKTIKDIDLYIKEAWKLENLRPLEIKENMKKGKRMITNG